MGGLELSVASASAAPSGHKNTVAIKLLDAIVPSIRYISDNVAVVYDIVAVVYGYTAGTEEEAVAAALTAPLG